MGVHVGNDGRVTSDASFPAPGVYTSQQAEPAQELVEVVARAIGKLKLYSQMEDQFVLASDLLDDEIPDIATAAINAIREWERR